MGGSRHLMGGTGEAIACGEFHESRLVKQPARGAGDGSGRAGRALFGLGVARRGFFAGSGRSGPADYERPQHVDADVVRDIADWLVPKGRGGFLRVMPSMIWPRPTSSSSSSSSSLATRSMLTSPTT